MVNTNAHAMLIAVGRAIKISLTMSLSALAGYTDTRSSLPSRDLQNMTLSTEYSGVANGVLNVVSDESSVSYALEEMKVPISVRCLEDSSPNDDSDSDAPLIKQLVRFVTFHCH